MSMVPATDSSRHFAVAENTGRGKKRLHYYPYGLERTRMLAGRRWIGTHEWYEEGAKFLLSQKKAKVGWREHVPTSFAILFLKRATTRTASVPAATGK